MSTWNELTQDCLNNNKTLHETSITVDRRGNAISGSYFLDVAKGKIPGNSVVFLSGRNANANTLVQPATIWNVGGRYPWSAWSAGANTIYLSSDSASDDDHVIINGLDINYNPITANVKINGTTSVNTGNTHFYRINSAIYVDNGQMNVGTINLRVGSPTGTVVGRIDPDFGITSMSVYTVPAGHTAFSVFGDFSVNKGEGAELNARWRFVGGGFITVYAIELYETAYSAAPLIPGAIPEKTDIDNTTRFVTSNGTRIYSNQQLLLVNNNYL